MLLACDRSEETGCEEGGEGGEAAFAGVFEDAVGHSINFFVGVAVFFGEDGAARTVAWRSSHSTGRARHRYGEIRCLNDYLCRNSRDTRT